MRIVGIYTCNDWCSIFGVLTLLLVRGVCQSINDTDTLFSDLFQGYNKHTKPTENLKDSLQISMGLYLLAIKDFIEIEERLSGVYALRFAWTDFKMRWDPALYNDTQYFTIDYREVWLPDFVILINPADDMSSLGAPWQRVWYFPNGLAYWYPGGNLNTVCPANVAKYPFDTQRCNIELIAWGFADDNVNLTNDIGSIAMDYYTENSIWEVIKTEVTRVDLNRQQSKLVFTIHLKRKSGFVVVSVIVPILFLSVLNLLVFLLPLESGERVSYSITCMLSIAVFMTIVSDTLPKNSDPVAIIAYVLMVELGVSGIVTVSTILIMRLYYMPDEKKVPIFMNKLRNLSVVNPTIPGERSQFGQGVGQNVEGRPGTGIKIEITEQVTEDPVCETTTMSWREVSVYLDTVCCIVLASVTILLYIVYFTIVLN